ncbi:MAG: antitoxin Xre/MbcA/ParS toxin-binding domain-containing protein [Thermodesulfovibrionales bacterium]|jgi:putative toxin-antitoxin system antitoxin component (TIGR02293 family)
MASTIKATGRKPSVDDLESLAKRTLSILGLSGRKSHTESVPGAAVFKHRLTHGVRGSLTGKAVPFGNKGYGTLEIAVKEGLPVQSAAEVGIAAKLTESEIAKLIGMSVSTLHRKRKRSAKLSVVESDRLSRVARIVARAAEVFNDQECGVGWLHQEQPGLGDRKPIDVIETEEGARDVERLLGRIEHGVLS